MSGPVWGTYLGRATLKVLILVSFGAIVGVHMTSSLGFLHDCTRSLQNQCFEYGFIHFWTWKVPVDTKTRF